ncbi:cell wall protein Ecm33, partial [Oleoguttula sp. CCFEE 5521]
SSEDLTDTCNHFQPLSGQNNVIKGTYSCSGGEFTPGGSGTLPSGTNSGSGTSGSTTSSSASTAVTITGATGLLGVVAAIFGML